MLAADGSTSFSAHLLRPAPAVRRIYPALLHYYLAAPAESVALEIRDTQGRLVRRFENGARGTGTHRVRWDLRYPGATVFPGIVLEGGDPRRGPWAPPGRYRVMLTARGAGGIVTDVQELELTKDPRLTDVSNDDLRAEFLLASQIRDRESAANEAVIRIREIRGQVEERLATDSLRVASDVRRRIIE